MPRCITGKLFNIPCSHAEIPLGLIRGLKTEPRVNPLIPCLSKRMPTASPCAFLGIRGAEGCLSGLRSWSPQPPHVSVVDLHQLQQATRWFFLGLFKQYPCCIAGSGARYLFSLLLAYTDPFPYRHHHMPSLRRP